MASPWIERCHTSSWRLSSGCVLDALESDETLNANPTSKSNATFQLGQLTLLSLVMGTDPKPWLHSKVGNPHTFSICHLPSGQREFLNQTPKYFFQSNRVRVIPSTASAAINFHLVPAYTTFVLVPSHSLSSQFCDLSPLSVVNLLAISPETNCKIPCSTSAHSPEQVFLDRVVHTPDDQLPWDRRQPSVAENLFAFSWTSVSHPTN